MFFHQFYFSLCSSIFFLLFLNTHLMHLAVKNKLSWFGFGCISKINVEKAFKKKNDKNMKIRFTKKLMKIFYSA